MPPAARPRLTPATIAAVVFLAAQTVAAIVHGLSDARLFHYTPCSGQTVFRLNVSVLGRSQTTAQIRQRYHLAFRGHTDLTPRAVQRIVAHHETAYATGTDTYVRMHFSRQRGPEEIWLWPHQ